MSELQAFEKFFADHGVSFETGENTHLHYKDGRKDSLKYIQVNSTYFHFGLQDKFIGSECDETGVFIARQ